MSDKHSPRKYVAGYLGSLLLTAMAFGLALTRSLHPGPLLLVLMVLAGLQIIVQLYFFMHVTEGDGPPFHLAVLLPALVFTFAIALMSIWIMGFGGALVA